MITTLFMNAKNSPLEIIFIYNVNIEKILKKDQSYNHYGNNFLSWIG